MELRYAVCLARKAQAHHRHIERGVVSRLGLVAEAHEAVERDTNGLGVLREVLFHQRTGEAVDACGNGGMGGEHRSRPGRLNRFIKGQVAILNKLTDAFQAEEPGVSFVGVEDLCGYADRSQRLDAAHAEHDFLAHPVFLSAAVETIGDSAAVGIVFLNVGVQQVQGDPTDLSAPHPSTDGAIAEGNGDPQLGGRAVGGGMGGVAVRRPSNAHRGDCHQMGFQDGIGLQLITVGAEGLLEVPHPVK